MYICLCNGISDKTIRHAIRKYQPSSLHHLRKIVPLGTECGKCIRQAREIFDEETAVIQSDFINVA